MTPQFILSADLTREPHCGPYTREARISEIENMGWAKECINADAGKKGILIANWNYFSTHAGELLEKYGYELFWTDQTLTCDDCGCAILSDPQFYGDTPSYWASDAGVVCSDCLDPDEYLEWCEQSPTRAVNMRGIDLAACGYIKLEGGFENGLHPGMNDNPCEIHKRLKDKFRHLVFAIDDAGQFSIGFSVWHKHDYEVNVGNLGSVYTGTNEADARREFAEYKENSESGYGRAAFEDVTLFRNEEIIEEYIAPLMP